jgi:hypothetical protein
MSTRTGRRILWVYFAVFVFLCGIVLGILLLQITRNGIEILVKILQLVDGQ